MQRRTTAFIDFFNFKIIVINSGEWENEKMRDWENEGMRKWENEKISRLVNGDGEKRKISEVS